MKIRQIVPILGLKGFLAIFSLISIAFALVTYSASVTVNPVQQFTIGSLSDSWIIYINEMDQVRYLPGANSAPILDSADINTYAFKVATDADQNCAVEIKLASPADNEKFSKFDITVDYWNGAAWVPAIIYDSVSGSNTITEIDGLSQSAAGYIHQDISTTIYYLLKVTYSYDIVDDLTQITTTFQYTPLP